MFKTILGMLSSVIIPLAAKALLSDAKESGIDWKKIVEIFVKHRTNFIKGFALLFVGAQMLLSLIVTFVVYVVAYWETETINSSSVVFQKIGIVIAVMMVMSLFMLYAGQKKVRVPLGDVIACFDSLKKLTGLSLEKTKVYSSADFVFDFVTSFFKPSINHKVQAKKLNKAA